MLLRLGLLLLGVGSLWLKFHTGLGLIDDDRLRALNQVAQGLTSQGYSATVSTGSPWRVLASKGQCRIAVRLIDAQSVKVEGYRQSVAETGPARYLWQGQWTDQAPRLQPLVGFLIQREMARQGWFAQRPAVWAVGSSAECPLPDARFAPRDVALLPPR